MAEKLPPLTQAQLLETRQPEIWGVTYTFTGVAIFMVFLRFYTRRVTNQSVWWDEYAIVAALIFLIAFAILVGVQIHKGFGHHIEAVNPDNLIFFYKSLPATESMYPLIVGLPKFSVMAYFWRIFEAHDSFRKPFWVLFTLIVMWTVGSIITILASCQPFNAFWNPSAGHCIPVRNLFVGILVPNIFIDVLLWSLPIPFITQLQLSTPRKVGLVFAFGIGALVIAISGVRLKYCIDFSLDPADFTWVFVPVTIWTMLEMTFEVICACLPTVAPLGRLAYRRFVTGSTRGYSRDYTDNTNNRQSEKVDSRFMELTKLRVNPAGKSDGSRMSDDVEFGNPSSTGLAVTE